MEKVDRKKLAKAALITASLAMGMTLGQSLFNEAQASSGSGWKFSYCTQYNGQPGGSCLWSQTPNCATPALCS